MGVLLSELGHTQKNKSSNTKGVVIGRSSKKTESKGVIIGSISKNAASYNEFQERARKNREYLLKQKVNADLSRKAEELGLPGSNSFQRKIDNTIDKNMKKAGVEKISSTIPAKNYVSFEERLKKAKTTLEEARENYNSARDYSVVERGLNAIVGNPTVFYDKQIAKEKLDSAKDYYFSMLNESLKDENISPQKTVQKGAYNLSKMSDLISWLNNDKKGITSKGGLLKDNKYSKYYHMEPNEVKMLTYLHDNDGEAAAEEFLEYITPSLNARMTETSVENAVEFANKHPVTADITAHALNLGKGQAVGENIINVLSGKEIDTNSSAHQNSIITNAIRQTVGEQMRTFGENTPVLKELGKVTSYVGVDNIPLFIYQTGVSAVDSAVNFAFAKGLGGSFGLSGTALNTFTSNATSVIMGSQVAQDSIIEGKAEGRSDGDALTRGIISGLIEGITEKYSIDNILDNPHSTLSKIIKSPYKKAFIAEGSEEWASNNLNRIADMIYYSDDNEVKKLYDSYIQKGDSKAKALSNTIYDLFKEDTAAFLAGGISGMAINFTNNMLTNIAGNNPVKVGKMIASQEGESQVIEAALSLNENTEAYKLAKEISESGNMSVSDIGNLALKVIEETTVQQNALVSNAVYDKAVNLGANVAEARMVSDYFTSVVTNKKISQAQIKAMEENPYVKEIAQEIEKGDINSWFFGAQQQLRSLTTVQDRVISVMTTQNRKLQSNANDGILSSEHNNIEDGEEYEQIRDSSGWARGENNDSEGGTGAVQEADGGIPGRSQEIGWQQTGRESLPNSEGNRRITPEQWESLKTTAIKTEDGSPKEVYHFTDNMEFEVFAEGDTGFHFGNEQQAISRGENKGKTGRIIKTFLDIKNPLHISTDIMNWKPLPLAFRLSVDGIISKEEYLKIEQLQLQSGGRYDSPAAVELRSILETQGYDGIEYENMFEGDGASYIAFYPEQVIIIDDGKSSLESGNGTADLQSTAEESTRPAFTEPEKSEIYRPLTSEDRIEAAFGRDRSSKQKQIESIAEKFGMTVYWNERYSGAVYSPKDKSIRMNPNLTLTQAYMVVFKHEFTHHLEGFKGYEGFKDYVFKHSNAFEAYVRGALEKENGQAFEGTREEAIKAYTDIVFDKRKAAEEIPASIRNAYTREEIEREIVADFVGEVLLFGENTEKSEQALLEIAQTNRTLLQKIMDWIKDVISFIKGDPHNRTLEEDLRYLNQRLARVYDSAQKNTAKNSGKEKYCLRDSKANVFNPEGKSLEEQLRDAYGTSDSFDQRYVYVGKFSQEFFNLLMENDIELYDYPIVMNFRDAYLSMHNRESGKYKGQGINYHNLGVEGLHEALESFKTPEHILKSKKSGKIELVLQCVDKKGNPILSIVAINTVTLNGNRILDAHVVTSSYGRRNIKNYIEAAKKEGRLIENKKEETSQGIPQVQYEGNINEISSNNSIPDNEPTVNNNSMPKTEKNTSKESFSVASEEFIAKMNKLTSEFKEGKISVDEFTEGVSKLAENERKVNGELRQAMAEMEKNHAAQYMDSVRYMAQQKKKIYRQSQQLKERRSEISRRITEQRDERASKQRNIEHIRKTVNRIDKLLRTNSDAKHVPEEFKEAAGQFVKIFLQNDTSPFNKKDLQQIRIVYYDLLRPELLPEDSETGALSGVDIEMIDNLRVLANRLDGKTLKQLDQYDLLLVRDIVDNFAHIISSQNEMFINKKREEIQQIGNAALRDIGAGDTKRDNAVIRAIDKHIKFSNMTPVYFFDRMGETFKSLFNDIVRGQDKWFRNIENSKTYISKIKEKYNYSKWGNDVLTLTTERGEKIEVTREQALLLYATARREYGNKLQRSEHLFKGGVVIDRVDKSLKDAIKNFNKAEGKGREKVVNAFTEEVDSRAHQITPKDISEVFAWLTKEQINYADALVEYLSKDMAALGNEVSMQMVGINKFNEDYYIPYNSARNFLYSQPGITNEARLKHQSFTKQTVVKANTPLILTSFSEVCADHINRMCMYNALTVPLENLNKIFNYKTTAAEGISSESVRAEIERVHGADAVTYIKQFIEDMNGNVRSSGEDSLISKWISKFKKGAVLASASVTIQQPSAIMRAMAHVDPKYFAKTTFKFAERDYQQAIMYASVAGIKDMGRFDTGTGAGTTQWLLHEKPQGLKEKVKAFVDMNDSYYRDETFSFFAAKADEITWAHIWAAVKAEVADKSDLKVGSDEYFERCGERFTEVINYTQVYDSTLSRSQIMRSKSTSAQMLTAFMSEPTIMLNNLMEAQNKSKSGGKVGKKECARIIGALVGNVLLNALLKSLVTAARDDDEDKTYLEKYLGDLTGNFVSDASPFSMIPFVKDVISIFEGYTVERADMNLFSDLAQSIKTVCSEEKSIDEKIESLSGSLAAFLGLPVKNVLRDTRAAYNLIDSFFASENKTTAVGVKYEILEGLGFDSSDSDKYEEMMRAADGDDEEKYQSIYKYLFDKGKTESQIWTGVKKAYKESTEVEKQVSKTMQQLEGNKTFESFAEEDKEELEKNIEKSLASQKAVDKVLSKKEKFDNLYEAYRTNKARYKSLKQQLADEGLSETQIEDGLESARLNYMQSKGIDIKEYLLFKMAKSNKYADTDNSGGVSNAERSKAINDMDISSKAKQYFKTQHK